MQTFHEWLHRFTEAATASETLTITNRFLVKPKKVVLFYNPARMRDVVRGFVGESDIVVWGAYGATHSEVVEQKPAFVRMVPVYIYPGQGVTITDFSRRSGMTEDQMKQVIENNPQIKKFFRRGVAIDFWNQAER